jgi:hypothetical protein
MGKRVVVYEIVYGVFLFWLHFKKSHEVKYSDLPEFNRLVKHFEIDAIILERGKEVN